MSNKVLKWAYWHNPDFSVCFILTRLWEWVAFR